MRAEKKGIVEAIRGALDRSAMLILTDHTGLSATGMSELRAVLARSGARYMVVKNTLLRRALDDASLAALEGGLAGPTAIAVTSGDCAALSKIIVAFAKENGAPKVKVGLLGGSALAAAQIGALAALPPREVLLARLVGGLAAPLSGLLRCMADAPRRFACVLNELARKAGGG
ncbi:MAG: 50S ribosomal protein L10 [bacterium]|nr:50S ribosomal protein L10 [bacterium]